MYNNLKRIFCWLIKPCFRFLWMVAVGVNAETYSVETAGCTGTRECSAELHYIDLDEGAGYQWEVMAIDAGVGDAYIKISVPSGSRSMGLWVNNTFIDVLEVDSSETSIVGKEIGPFSIPLVAGNNLVELRDSEGTEEFNIHSLRVESTVIPELQLSVTNNGGNVYVNENVNLTAFMTSGTNWQYEWKLIQDETYYKKEIYDLTWNSSWEANECHANSFGTRITGKLYPPETGSYQFAVAADDMHELRIISNGTGQLLTHSNQATSPAGYFTANSQTSQPIYLDKDIDYEFEFLHINQAGAGHFSILWKLPGSNMWQEIPAEAFSKIDDIVPTGRLSQQVFNEYLTSFNQLKNLESYVAGSSNIQPTPIIGQSISYQPGQNKKYTFEVTATSGAFVVRKDISFFAQSRFVSEDDPGALNAWIKTGTTNQNLLSQMKLTSVSDGTASGQVLEIGAPSGGSPAAWKQVVYLEPYHAYELRARVRLLNAPSDIEIPTNKEDQSAWKLPRIRVGVHGDSSQQGINPHNPSQWQDVVVDFIVPFHGQVDFHLHMGDHLNNGAYSGIFQVDNLHLVKLTGDTVTKFEFSNLVANVYDGFVAQAGGEEKVINYFQRLSIVSEDMRELSGKSFLAQCMKQNIWIPRHWYIQAMGTYYNHMVLKDQAILTDKFLEEVWGSNDIVGGLLLHELEHSFDFANSDFHAHLSQLLQVYSLQKNNFLRSYGESYLASLDWIAQEYGTLPICSLNSQSLLPKLYEFQALLGADKWRPFKQIMHDRWSPYKIDHEGRLWAGYKDYYGQYLKWWSELESYTGIDGWSILHSSNQQATIRAMLQRIASPIEANLDPSTISNQDELYLHQASSINASVGYDVLNVNELAEVNGQCHLHNIYAHATSSVTYRLNKKWMTFHTDAIIRNNSVPGRVIARVLGDGIVLYDSGAFTAQTSPVTSGYLDVSNVDKLTLEFLDDGDPNSDWSMWVNPMLARGSSALDHFSDSARVIKHSGGKCVAPQSGTRPSMNERAVLSDDCSSNNVKFRLLASGALMHLESGACLHPDQGSNFPSNGTNWVFFPDCFSGDRIHYDHIASGSIQHRSGGSCIRPTGGANNPVAGTELEFHSTCNLSTFTFE